MDAVREGIEQAGGWALSGLQKTTSMEFEGRWEGESTRSAYLFFHPSARPDGVSDDVSIDAYLDETSRGLTGNLALVVDVARLGSLGEPQQALEALGALAKRELPAGYSTPLTLRLRLANAGADAARAEVEARFKLDLPETTIASGPAEVRRLTHDTVAAFERILASDVLARYLPSD